MKGIWRGEDNEMGLRTGKEYEIIGYVPAFDAYGVVDESGDSYLYPVEDFDITEEEPKPPVKNLEAKEW